eukprot:TRINITY_DN3566_c0_g1_i1.p1 TRINITY_DN3566_c0_g1~~TRINITY_DN3566_c0_g1_i1.p1  ORF type:complete len:177 (-),score=78.06 TRINITY_DN3566_c0_g1_i1:133-663(-)
MDFKAIRKTPNILITGTPGTGKTTTAEMIASATGLNHLEVGALVREKKLHSGLDKVFDSFILDEDKLCDEMEELLKDGNNVVDFHSSDFFPERWFDLVVVLRADTSVLYDRLEKKGFAPVKIQENIQCEIMQICLEEAASSYKNEIIIELQSNNLDQLDNNVAQISRWIENYIQTH